MTHREADGDSIAIGEQIGDFRVVGKLAGGWYRALEFTVARRALVHVGGPDTDIETTGLDTLHHPGIARVIAHGTTTEQRPWVASELVNGHGLHDVISQRVMPHGEVLQLIRYVAEVLAAAHRAGVVHRALTPRSITLVAGPLDFPVSVGDWGLRYRRLNAFTAPEGRGDGRVDIYALGVIAHRAAIGRLPHPGEAISVPGAPPAMSALLACMLATDPVQRPTAAETVALANDVMATSTGDAVAAALEAAVRAAAQPVELASFSDDDLAYVRTPRFARPKWTPAPPAYSGGIADTVEAGIAKQQ